jgi:hypothetical protein
MSKSDTMRLRANTSPPSHQPPAERRALFRGGFFLRLALATAAGLTMAYVFVAVRSDEHSTASSSAQPRQRGRTNAPSPSFTASGDGRIPEFDPRSPTYMPRKLFTMVGSLSSMYDAEPRDEAWASAVEQKVGSMISQDLTRLFAEKVTNVVFTCRTAVCKVEWTLASNEPSLDQSIRQSLNQLFPALMKQLPNGRLLLFNSANFRDVDTLLSEINRRRNNVLVYLRSQRSQTPYANIEPSRWPEPNPI